MKSICSFRRQYRLLPVLLLLLLLILRAPAAQAATPASVLNSAELHPNHFLARSSQFYQSEMEASRGCEYLLKNNYGVWFLPENADELIRAAIQSHTTADMTTYQKVLALYDYIIDTTDYYSPGMGNYCSVYYVLEQHIGNCNDYNYVMMAFLRYLGIDAALVMGQTHAAAGGYTGHAWVEAYIGGETYIFDPQIDDNLAARSGAPSHQRFCKTYAELPEKYYPYEDKYWNYYPGVSTLELDEAYYAPVYSYDYYRKNNADLAALFGDDRASYLAHFLASGMAEGRRGCRAFDAAAYRAKNPDLAAALGDDLKAYYIHYLEYGQYEGRKAR